MVPFWLRSSVRQSKQREKDIRSQLKGALLSLRKQVLQVKPRVIVGHDQGAIVLHSALCTDVMERAYEATLTDERTRKRYEVICLCERQRDSGVTLPLRALISQARLFQ
jgi:hypothetical protein